MCGRDIQQNDTQQQKHDTNIRDISLKKNKKARLAHV